MISAILIYGQRGEILASRIYKEGSRRAITDAFRVQVISNPEVSSPILTMGSTSFSHIRHNESYIVAVTRSDADAIVIFEVLYRLCEICTAQLGRFDEAACYRFVAEIYEIFDEIIDYGYPQNTEAGVLKLSRAMDDRSDGAKHHHDDGHGHHHHGPSTSSFGGSSGSTGVVSSSKRTLTNAKSGSASTATLGVIGGGGTNSSTATNSAGGGPGQNNVMATRYENASNESDVPWRRSDVKHRRNEIYLDVIERINAVFEPSGQMSSVSVDGLLKVKAQLSGLPHCQVDLDNFSVLENSQFHACVDHAAFQKSGVVQFVPPEGDFDLLRYRVTRSVKVPLTIFNTLSSGELTVRVRCNLDPKKHLTNVVILIPLANTSTSSSQRLKSSSGKAKFSAEKTAIEWKIARVAGQHDATSRMTSDELTVDNGPILASFSINMFTCSTLRVQSLQVVEDSKYTTLKWVRYLTEAGACEARMRM